jgi:hypothetical protein
VSWKAALLASPAFFGPRNRIPAVAILETRAFAQSAPEENITAKEKYLAQYTLPFEPGLETTAAWLVDSAWQSTDGTLSALNAAAGYVNNKPGSKSGVMINKSGEPALITILEGL